jgi:cyclophilin family peptidyl-prolyl cis-trans isomerase
MEELRRAQLKSQKRRRYISIAVVVAVMFVAFLFLTGQFSGSKKKKVATSTSPTTAAGATATTAGGPTTTSNNAVPVLAAPANVGCPKPDGSSPHYTKFTAAPPNCIDATKTYTATIQTDVGNIVVKLDQKKAPKTANNFVFLADYHFFDGIVFHRVLPGFVDQGGDPQGTGSGGPGYSFADELPQPADYKAGSLAMANSGANTNGSQFFILVSDAAGQQLVQAVGGKANYSLFGQVTSGMDVVTKINNDGAADPSPPKVLHRMVKVTIAVT